MPVLSKRIVLDCFYLLIFYSEKFSTDVCRLPYAVNVNLVYNVASYHRLTRSSMGIGKALFYPFENFPSYLLISL